MFEPIEDIRRRVIDLEEIVRRIDENSGESLRVGGLTTEGGDAGVTDADVHNE